MKKIFILLLLVPCFCSAQFVIQGVCTQSGNTFTLNGISQSPYAGRFFSTTAFNLNNDFDLHFNAYLGSVYNNGMAFLFMPGAQPTASSPATVINTDNIHNFGTGSIANDFVIEFDIRGSFCYSGQNTSYEPLTDINHISYWKNNSACNFGNYFSAYSALGTINYYAFEPYEIKWTKASNTLQTYYNNVLIKSNIIDLVALLGTSVYWGFSSGCYCVTGGPAVRDISLNGIGPLPLTLVEFNGHLSDDNSILNWKTDDEHNTRSFDIERSIDGRNYTRVSTVAVINQPGTHQYTYTDNYISYLGVPVVYYRLKQNDIDGKVVYSRIIALPVNYKGNIIRFYPNPVVDEANLTVAIKRSELVVERIIDNTGRTVRQQEMQLPAGSSSWSVQTKGLAPGMYYLELKGETIHERKQFVKQ